MAGLQTTFGGLHEGKVGKDLGGKFDWSKERSFSLVQPTPRLVRIEITYPDFLVV